MGKKEILHNKGEKAILLKSIRAPFFKGEVIELAKNFTADDLYFQFKIKEDKESLAKGEFKWLKE